MTQRNSLICGATVEHAVTSCLLAPGHPGCHVATWGEGASRGGAVWEQKRLIAIRGPKGTTYFEEIDYDEETEQ